MKREMESKREQALVRFGVSMITTDLKRLIIFH